ncbi:hypothetical protein [Ferruginibacter profundus]
MAKSKHCNIGKIHRWLGIILGIQFLVWTTGGLFFSWSNMDKVYEGFQPMHPAQLLASFNFVSFACRSIQQHR